MNSSLLVLVSLSDDDLDLLRTDFDVTYAPDDVRRQAAIAEHPSRFDVVLTNGVTGITAADIDRCKHPAKSSCFAAGSQPAVRTQRCGSNSSIRLLGWVGSRSRMSLR